MLQGSVSSFGDYNECLEIKGQSRDVEANGKYCLVKFSIKHSTVKQAAVQFLTSIHPVAEFYHPLHGLCIPSACSKDDLELILSQKVFARSGHFKLEEITHCDTKESIEFKFYKLTSHQKVAFIFVAFFVLLAMVASVADMLGISLFKNHSIIHNTQSLLEPGQAGRDSAADLIKTAFALYGVAIHSIVAVTTPIGVYVLSRLNDIHSAIKIVWIQPFINVHGLHAISFISGMTMGFSTYPASKKQNGISYGSIVIERWLRNAPGVLCLIAIEFLWPIAGAGPLYTYVGDDVIINCSKNWMRNVFFITNYNPVSQNCANHTFWSSVDFQLFCIGLVAIYILSKSKKLGILFIAAVGFTDFALTTYFSIKYNTSHSMATYPMSVAKVIEYVDVIHNPTTNYLFTFISGLSLGAYLTEKKAPNLGTISFVLAIVLWQVAAYSTAFFNDWYHDHPLAAQMTGAYFIFVKVIYTLSFVMIMTFLVAKSQSSSKPKEGKSEKESNGVTGEAKKIQSKSNSHDQSNLGYRLYLAVSRLSTSLYLVNYWFIRYDFFTAYAPFETSTISFFKRFGYSVCFSEMLAYAFHVIFLAPVDLYRRQWITPLFKKKVD